MTPDQQAFIVTTKAAAQEAAQKINLSPTMIAWLVAITVAQAILESGWGKTSLYILCKNPFGIKFVHLDDTEPYTEHDFTTTEYVNGAPVHEIQAFKSYDTLADAFTDHAALLMLPRYASMWLAASLQDCVTQLMMDGYSTDRPPLCQVPGCIHYAGKLMQIINEFELAE